MSFIDMEGKPCNATFQLSGEELADAYNASRIRSNVRVTGILTGGKRKRIEDIKMFRVLDR